ncbi:DUF423 domain-containing protein [Acidihalobacter ferrooxydans]|uniref:DUF423 domain-containing protein n=1 Tax=Acidihalobacter ferrooxydans TaxID=1765967 RepID=A0A1P8UIH8_9GAMM|nr:DUF423 domain-containing protein [Acidihalobacter ferrooxydans]APZ43638.1 hypothetical protein BW247_11525 [Acidihalobacter ferrooxydans]
MDRTFLALGALLGMFGVILGAVGAHLVHPDDTHKAYAIFETALRFQFYHALGLLLIGVSAAQLNARAWLRAAGWLMFAGVLLFSGSLYLMTLFGLHAIDVLAPFGGSALILSWLLYFIAIIRSRP